MKEIDSYYSRGHQPFKTNEPAREQKDYNSHKSKPQKYKALALQRSDSAKISEKAWKKKKKNDQRNKRDCRTQKSFTSDIGINIKTTGNGNFKRRN